MLKSLEAGEKKREFYDANFIEDAALILLSRLKQDGYLKPEVAAKLTLADGKAANFSWKENIGEPLPRSLRARKIEFKLKKGVLYRYGTIDFKGLKSIREKEAKSFFVEQGVLVPLKKTRIFTPQKLERSVSSLREVLARKGFETATVTATNIVRHDKNGKVNVTVQVREGKKSIVRSVRQELFYETNTQPAQVTLLQTNAPYSKLWQQDFVQGLKRTNYHRGYPDTTVQMSTLHKEDRGDSIDLALDAKIKTGPQIKIGAVKFEGEKRTKKALLKRRVKLHEGQLLDRVAVEQARYRLSRLGIFENVELRYDQVNPHTRDVIYRLKEGKIIDFSLLIGYGSYELARGGFELDQYNIFGRAHHAHLKAVQSLKSTSADFLYTMPELVGEDVDVFFNASFLRRQEITFTRQEFGGGFGARTIFQNIDSDFGARYSYQVLNAEDANVNVGPTNAGVGSVIFDLKHDRRDNPLYPRKGYRIYSGLELASKYLAGEVDFARFEFAASYHQPLDEGRWLHFGMSHGAALTQGGPLKNLPFNKRFFPGGDNSVRGYQFGEAAPRDEAGHLIGAESFTVGNVEFEQSLSSSFSLITFVDAVGLAREIHNYPFDEILVSVGGGVSWKTVIGPVRLEYGYNLNRRRFDPTGTIQFSIGFPF
ncbi:MAG: BamA/TamA family outer membrane protein [Verrucomicrobiota bacterium]|nr:BamA/TamA family outer membrane protein [Verrucomicrobiota bacterium]